MQIPRILVIWIKEFVKLLVFIVVCSAIILGLVMVGYWLISLGLPLWVYMIPLFLILCAGVTYPLAKLKLDDERRDQKRIEDILKRP